MLPSVLCKEAVFLFEDHRRPAGGFCPARQRFRHQEQEAMAYPFLPFSSILEAGFFN